MMKFLFDECLSPTLVRLAINAGHPESTCVRDRGWRGLKDWQLLQIALEELAVLADLVNQALEITENEDGSIDIDRYSIP